MIERLELSIYANIQIETNYLLPLREHNLEQVDILAPQLMLLPLCNVVADKKKFKI